MASSLLLLYYVQHFQLKGYVKGEGWQRQYLWQCIVQGIVEVVLFQTMVINILILRQYSIVACLLA